MEKLLIPPMVWLLAALAMVLLDSWLPEPRLRPPAVAPWAFLPAVLGLALIAWAALGFRRAGTTVKPHEAPTALVIEGPYRFSRNPMYVGLALLLFALWLTLGGLASALVVPLFIVVIDRVFIRREEHRLHDLFGPSYLAYKARVRRWI